MELATVEQKNGIQVTGLRYNAEQIALIKNQVARDCTDGELQLFLYQCQRTGLDALNRQIYAIKRGGKMSIQTSIDGFRLIAERSGKYEGQTAVMWCGPEGQWTDVWLAKEMPAAAKVGVWRTGFREAVFAVAKWNEYADMSGSMWKKMGAHMLAKCAESLALRKAFPQELSGLLTAEEMDQADRPAPEQVPAQVVESAQAPTVPEEVQKAWRKWRAAANKSFQAAKTPAELEAKRTGMEEITKEGAALWGKLTYHNETETFGSLYTQHKDRVVRDNPATADHAAWRELVSRASLDRFDNLREQYTNTPELQTHENSEALTARGRELGLEEYADRDDEDDGRGDYQG